MTQPDPNASGVDPSAQSGTGEPDGSNTGTGTTPDPSAQSGAVNPDTGRVYTAQEYEALRARMQAADQNRAKFEQELRQLKDKDLPELEKLKRDHAEAVARAEAAEQKARDRAIHNSFLQDNTHEWHSPQRALQLLDMSKVDYDEESGEVRGLKDAINALAKSDPWLLKPKADENSGDSTPQLPGTNAANNGGTGSGKPSKDKLQSRFTAMRGRA